MLELLANVPYAESVMDNVVEQAAEQMLLPKVLAALADPHRLATIRFLARHGESWGAAGRAGQRPFYELSKSTFSHHLRIMRKAGLVTKRIQGAPRATPGCAGKTSTAASLACSIRSSTPRTRPWSDRPPPPPAVNSAERAWFPASATSPADAGG